jgi:2-polyprenyl-3-methyl-5-hydroxy-6-metoxy-1,4-benzoquinol methylase
MMDNLNKVKKNRFGYYEVIDKPTEEELSIYYSQKYYQTEKGSYQKEYSDDEQLFFNNKLEQKYAIIKDLIKSEGDNSLLDVGCGEGWALSFFKSKNWEVTGIDYSDYGCHHFHPKLINNLIIGDIYEELEKLEKRNKKFDLIWLTNVLEHVINPEILIESFKNLLNNDGILLIQVPNDFSLVQSTLLERKYISKPFWIALPDHLSYFSKDGLVNLLVSKGFIAKHITTDFPIDFNLFNPETNYVENKKLGRNVHLSRVAIENMFHDISVEKTNKLYETLASMGLGREIIGFFKKE